MVEILVDFDTNTFHFKLNNVDYGDFNKDKRKIPQCRTYVSSCSINNHCTFLDYKMQF